MMESREKIRKEVLDINDYNRPYECEKCGGLMIFKGCGEYECENCRNKAYDDYGKARNYIEKNPGATSADITINTGVTQKSIRQMLKESRLEVAQDSKVLLRCEMCGADIRTGVLCPSCEVAYHRKLEDKQRVAHKMTGYGADKGVEQKGEKRFQR